MLRLTAFMLFCVLCSTSQASTFYLSANGDDNNTGLTADVPWLSANHPLNCGDVIIAAASDNYRTENFSSGKWGNVTCPASNNVAWLKCVAFDACKIRSGYSGQAGMWVDRSYWGVQGWEISVYGGIYAGCFIANSTTSSGVLHHVIFANNVANICQGGGFGSNADYLAIIGNIAYNTAQGSGECFSGIGVYEPQVYDTRPGTHIYIAGNLSSNNIEPPYCGGGQATDGQGIFLDTLNGSQTNAPPYTQQILVDNNISVYNGASGIDNGGSGNSNANVYIRSNTVFGNWKDVHQSTFICGQILLAGYPAGPGNVINSTNVTLNLVQPQAPNEPGCGNNAAYSFATYNATGSVALDNNFGFTYMGTDVLNFASAGFSLSGDNIFGINPRLAYAARPDAPYCSGTASVPDCIAGVIANFAPTNPAASAYGFHRAGTAPVTDPLFPKWLCTAKLPPGLVNAGCPVRTSSRT